MFRPLLVVINKMALVTSEPFNELRAQKAFRRCLKNVKYGIWPFWVSHVSEVTMISNILQYLCFYSHKIQKVSDLCITPVSLHWHSVLQYVWSKWVYCQPNKNPSVNYKNLVFWTTSLVSELKFRFFRVVQIKLD